MGKIGGLALISALALTGCSAPAASGPAPTVTATVTAAPIQALPESSSSATKNSSGQITGSIGDPAADDFYLRSVRPAWRGEKPSDSEFIAAAALACQQLKSGVSSVSVVTGKASEDVRWNNQKVVEYAAQVYCPAS